ncbi:sugar kinase [Haloferax sp. Atlit-12N]|uniref:Sugar kinase n=1 Tax=Haloferax gibbonsii TaxID=35746 RepID=A0A0K1IQ11_HALGI|nr:MULTISPECIES: hypothetical protein [Haloferax]AKU06519.1 sugar kinase [Haloferax gibbonsii]RDZ54347.1 sugar kinase [Haloferax sp. Atlit-4N]RDZ65872.1 sugar kinase [Haloferax sp. Atlit-12N]
MPKVGVPFLDTEVDTDEPGESAQNLGLATIGVMIFLAIMGAATWAYNKLKETTGVDQGTGIPVAGE